MMKTLAGALLGTSIFAVVALAIDSQYKTRFITSATFTIHVREGVYLTIRNFTQDTDAPGQRGVVIAAVIPSTPTPTATPVPTPTPTLSTNASPGVAVGGTLNDTAILFGDKNPTGTITFTLFDPTNLPVYTDVVTVSGNATYTTSMGNNPGGFVATTIGTYRWTALYSGDINNNAATDNMQNETAIVTATPTPPPAPSATPTPINAVVLTASLLHPPANVFNPVPAEFVKPIIIAGPATLTIDPVPPATLSITYRKSLQPIQPTPTPTSTVIVISGATVTPTVAAASVGTSTTSSHSAIVADSMMLDDDDIDSSTPTPTPTATPTQTAIPTPTATPSITPRPTPSPTPTP